MDSYTLLLHQCSDSTGSGRVSAVTPQTTGSQPWQLLKMPASLRRGLDVSFHRSHLDFYE